MIVARRGNSQLDDLRNGMGQIIGPDGRRHPPAPIISILARGYWEPVEVPLSHGGPGSGNWGHTSESRKGVGQGGSDPGGGAAAIQGLVDKLWRPKETHVFGRLDDYDPLNAPYKKALDRNYINGESLPSSSEQHVAFMSYKSVEWVEINKALRAGEDYERADLMKSLIDSTPPLPEDLVLFRGVGRHAANQLVDAGEGTVFEDKGMQSFSLEPQVSNVFAHEIFTEETGGLVDNVVMLTFQTEGKTKGVFMGGQEEEVVLKPCKWEVAGRFERTFERDDAKYRYIFLKVRPV